MKFYIYTGLSVMVLAVGVLSACSSDDDNTPAETTDAGADTGPGTYTPFPGDPLMTVLGDNGLLNVAIRTDPQPLTRLQNSMELTVTDNAGNPVDGLTISINPNMPSMGHGSPKTTPLFDAQGNGKYLNTNVYFQMMGPWQLDITFTGTVADHVAPMVDIP